MTGPSPVAVAMAAFPARDIDAHAAHWQRILADEDVDTKAIVVAGEVVGNIVSWVEDGRREVGYWLGTAYWGHGIATLALEAFLRQRRDRPLYAHVARANPASIRVLLKCGFVPSPDLAAADADEDEVLLVLRG
jgi:RimJ/RimL family protein N-acetyltransferase